MGRMEVRLSSGDINPHGAGALAAVLAEMVSPAAGRRRSFLGRPKEIVSTPTATRAVGRAPAVLALNLRPDCGGYRVSVTRMVVVMMVVSSWGDVPTLRAPGPIQQSIRSEAVTARENVFDAFVCG